MPEQETVDRFLRRLDPDRERAGERYETIRRKVVKFFQWRGCSFPEDHADEVMRRMIGKFAQNQDIEDPSSYSSDSITVSRQEVSASSQPPMTRIPMNTSSMEIRQH